MSVLSPQVTGAGRVGGPLFPLTQAAATSQPYWAVTQPSAPPRSAVTSYQIKLSSPPTTVSLATSAVPSWPSLAPAARRALDFTITTSARPTTPIVQAPAASPYFPGRALAAARSSPAAYSVVTVAPPSLVALDLGRFRCGQSVNLSFALPGQTSVPVLTVSGPNGTTSIPLSTRDGTIFTTQIFLGNNWLLGNYVATVQIQAVQFEVVAGGDPAGGIVSIYATKSVNGWLVVAQLRSGGLVSGTNPQLP